MKPQINQGSGPDTAAVPRPPVPWERAPEVSDALWAVSTSLIATLKSEELDLVEPPSGWASCGYAARGGSPLASSIDRLSERLWPEDESAVDPLRSDDRDYLVVFSAEEVGGAFPRLLHFFVTYRPSTAPWIPQLDEVARSQAKLDDPATVVIDASARLCPKSDFPPRYGGTAEAYLINLYWLAIRLSYRVAVMEINAAMQASLSGWGIDYSFLAGVPPRVIGTDVYRRAKISLESDTNSEFLASLHTNPPLVHPHST